MRFHLAVTTVKAASISCRFVDNPAGKPPLIRAITYVTGSSPIIEAVSPLAIVPASSERITSGTTSSRRSGYSALIPAMTMPTDEKLAKPHMA